MDYEYYDAPFEEMDDLTFIDQSTLLCALELYEDIERKSLIVPNIPIMQAFNLYFGFNENEGCYMWKLHHYEVD